ncbi:MAG: 3-hydroxyacyl-CoA dehydrogenase family protein [Spirochaetes bacterium]|nr:3-hydroxyacyl-CoA dehydrogenase family protein [Spirochaetota bacterium]
MQTDTVKHIGIIGTGMMASSMAVLTTGHGCKTSVLARSPQRAQSCRDDIDSFYREITDNKLITQKQSDICKGYLNFAFTYEEMADVDVFFECVAEVPEAKHTVYREIEKHCPNVKVICSVSSSIVADDLVKKAGKYRDRIIVTHPFNPPHLVPFFELAKGADTREGVVEFAVEILEALDRKPVVLKKTVPGFIGNRLQFALWREVLYLVENGIADPGDIDTCLMYSFCPRYTSIGIFEHFDNGGMQLNYNVVKTLFPVLSDEKNVPGVITEKIEAGDMGQKTGKGFYDWRNVDMDAYRKRVSAPYWKFFNWDIPEE